MTFSLKGQLLVAMPDMEDERFKDTVIYMCAHSEEEGAMGLVVNKRMPDIQFADLMAQFDIKVSDQIEEGHADPYQQPIVVGGPVETGRGFVLHTPDYQTVDNSMNVADNMCLSTTLDILRSIAEGDGPEKALLALGYCGWEPGQLESELVRDGWMVTSASDELIFTTPVEQRYQKALKDAGIELAYLSPTSGSA
ncbi:YqgE/AlgH family protein [Maritalea myrionectae]|uniref:YqgE/AlgH family protein n=1 Tax=Maritalea myrionectae TaxID=454601 RepID=UPI0003F6D1FD|nr:YqgE/AlgH family protein [Maritalea myrionectae]